MASEKFRINTKEKRFWNIADILPYLISNESQAESTLNTESPLKANIFSYITELDLSGNSYSEEVIEFLIQQFESNKNIKRAFLNDLFTGRLKITIPPAITEFVRLFDGNSVLVELDLSDNAFGPVGAHSLKPILINNPSIEILRINNNGLGPDGGRIIAKGLTESYELNVLKKGNKLSLKTIVMGRNRLESSSIDLARSFSLIESIEEVYLPQNGIRSEWISSFLLCLQHVKNLKVLDIEDNTLTESGSLQLSKCLKYWPHLRILNVADCLMRSEGGKTVIKRLSELKSGIEFLNLRFNELDEECILMISNCLVPTLNSLKKLHLDGNSFNPEGVGALKLMESIKSIDHVIDLDEWEELDYELDEEEDDEELTLMEKLKGLSVN